MASFNILNVYTLKDLNNEGWEEMEGSSSVTEEKDFTYGEEIGEIEAKVDVSEKECDTSEGQGSGMGIFDCNVEITEPESKEEHSDELIIGDRISVEYPIVSIKEEPCDDNYGEEKTYTQESEQPYPVKLIKVSSGDEIPFEQQAICNSEEDDPSILNEPETDKDVDVKGRKLRRSRRRIKRIQDIVRATGKDGWKSKKSRVKVKNNKESELEKSTKLYRCGTCNKTFSDKEQIAEHLKNNCNKSKKGVKKSKNEEGEGENGKSLEQCFVCSHCGHVFKAKYGLRIHIYRHMSFKPHVCAICSKSFVNASGLMKHRKIHSDVKSYKCNVCEKSFARSDYLRDHRLIHSEVKRYKCEVCSKKFGHGGNLKRHMLIHKGEMPFKCRICSRRFREKGTLTGHQRVHDDARNFECEVCFKTFKRPYSLSLHIKTHENKKPFKCDYCEKCYVKPSQLKDHMTIHTGEKPYNCRYCTTAFRTSSLRSIHERTYHEQWKSRTNEIRRSTK